MLLCAALCAPAVAAAQPVEATAPVEPFSGILLLGSSPLPPSRIAAQVASLVGQPADAALLAKIRLAVSAAYDAAGFRLVSVDMPVMRGSTALVRVQPLSLGRIDVKMADGSAPAPGLPAQAAAALPALRVGETPDLIQVDRQLRLANLQPHRRWTVDFRSPDTAALPTQPVAALPSATATFNNQRGQSIASAKSAPGAVPQIRLPGYSAKRDAEATVDARVVVTGANSLFGRALLDNAGQPATGRERLRVQLGHGDLLGPGRSLDLTGLVSITDPDRQNQIALRYQHPLADRGTLITAELSLSRSKPGLVGDFFDVSGNTKVASLSARHLLARQGTFEPYLDTGFSLSVNDDIVEFFGQNLGAKVGTSPLALALGATWQGDGWSVFGQMRLLHNLGIGPSSAAANYDAARAGATPRWTTLDAFVEARRALGSGLEAVLRGQGQWTGDALISPQLFRAGGQNTMRGLIESEMAGDSGAALSFELWGALAPRHRLGGLVDGAATRRNKALAGEPASSRAASVGLAWQWDLAAGLRLVTTGAHVVAARNLPLTRAGETRVNLLLDWNF
jgi:hemolysin activation/secretion protein